MPTLNIKHLSNRINRAAGSRGFSLIEVAVVLFIIVLLLGSILVPLSTQVEQRQISDTQKTLNEIHEALIGYAVVNGNLPCPAISATNGQEARTGNACTSGARQGYLPWQTLGVPRSDAWDHLYRYSVTPAYTISSPTLSMFNLATVPDITIQTRNATGALINLTNTNSVPAVIISHGKNGFGSVNVNNIAQKLPDDWPASNTDENTNINGATTFVNRDAQGTNAGGAGGEFDDIVVWVSRYTLMNRMVSAGKLPY